MSFRGGDSPNIIIFSQEFNILSYSIRSKVVVSSRTVAARKPSIFHNHIRLLKSKLKAPLWVSDATMYNVSWKCNLFLEHGSSHEILNSSFLSWLSRYYRKTVVQQKLSSYVGLERGLRQHHDNNKLSWYYRSQK